MVDNQYAVWAFAYEKLNHCIIWELSFVSSKGMLTFLVDSYDLHNEEAVILKEMMWHK